MDYLPGGLAEQTRLSYRNIVRDAVAYFRNDAGEEIPVRDWTKDMVWGYLHHVENNYCRALNGFLSKTKEHGSFASSAFGKAPPTPPRRWRRAAIAPSPSGQGSTTASTP